MNRTPTAQDATALKLGIPGFTYADLYEPAKLKELADLFDAEAKKADPELFAAFDAYRKKKGEGVSPTETSDLLCRMGAHLDRFVVRLFGIEEDGARLRKEIGRLCLLFPFKNEFVLRRVLKKYKPADAAEMDFRALDKMATALQRAAFPAETPDEDPEITAGRMVSALLSLEREFVREGQKIENDAAGARKRLSEIRGKLGRHAEAKQLLAGLIQPAPQTPDQEKAFLDGLMELLERWAFSATQHPAGKERTKGWISFHGPEKMDYTRLVEFHGADSQMPEAMEGPIETRRRRDGFKLTDRRFDRKKALAEVDYCVFCHDRDKDSCSKGYLDKKGARVKNPVGIVLDGCPLREKISEAHWLKKQGDSIAALAMITIDNPMVPGTGHRICNDCMKACIYQKQEPVNIPQAETRILTDVLDLPWGLEIYGLLTRWNPLNVKRPCALPYNGKNVLVVGMGPAGYTLSQFLLNEGYGVVGVDGLKIEPLPADLVGDDKTPPRPVRNWREEIERELDERILAGFGGVAEYGITVRWDKNFLSVIHITLMRRRTLRVFGGTRFGGTLTADDAWALGFDHVAIAAGAGRPTVVEIKNNLIRGIRKASDFLMALQLTGAAKRESMANLQVRLPAIVIGGGLTAIDMATELIAYYPHQVEKILDRYEALVAEMGEEAVLKLFDAEEKGILQNEFLPHGREVRAERARAAAAGEPPDFVPLVRKFGGVRILYRRAMTEAPAYRLNHEEIIKSFEEGVVFIEHMNPVEAFADQYGALKEMTFERQKNVDGKLRGTGEILAFPARACFVAAGTTPNIIYEKEFPGTFAMDRKRKFFQRHRLVDDGGSRRVEPMADDAPEPSVFTSYSKDGKFITYYGDNHPVYAGNVVRAMASARDGFGDIVRLFEKETAGLDPKSQPSRDAALAGLFETLEAGLRPRVVKVERLTPQIVEVTVKAPFQAKRFQSGQFFRLQNYERNAHRLEGTTLAMEGLALTGAWVDREKGLLSMIALEIGVSSRLVASLRPGDPVIVMGPTGAPTEIPEKPETVLLLGGGLGNAVLFSIGQAMRQAGSRVLYFAGYKKPDDVYKVKEIEAAADVIVWSVDVGESIKPTRPQDKTFVGNIVQSMLAYEEGKLGEKKVSLKEVDRIIAIGSDRMMAAVKDARRGVLAPHLKPAHEAIASINSTMQCMMKEVCAQCLCRHVDPQTGAQADPVFSCFNQDQKMDEVDWPNLNARLRANSVQEKIANLWFNRLLKKKPEILGV